MQRSHRGPRNAAEIPAPQFADPSAAKANCPFGKQLVDDVLNRTETVMTQAHAFLASELAVRAQMKGLERPRA